MIQMIVFSIFYLFITMLMIYRHVILDFTGGLSASTYITEYHINRLDDKLVLPRRITRRFSSFDRFYLALH